jgi:DNA-directed RNA polymerase sigma subunit (sigma70/sigma32)
LQEVGAEVSLTRERVRQIQVRALKKLSVVAKGRNIDCSLLSASNF